MTEVSKEICDERTKYIAEKIDGIRFEYQKLTEAVILIEKTMIVVHDTLLGIPKEGKEGVLHKVDRHERFVVLSRGAYIGVVSLFSCVAFMLGLYYSAKGLKLL